MRASHRVGSRLFVAGGAVLFAVGLFFISNRQRLFHSNFEVYAEFDRLSGLQNGAPVRVSGMQAGELLETQVPDRADRRFRLRLRIQENVHALVQLDSVATIKTAGLAGESFIDLEKGSPNSPEAPAGGTIPSREPVEMGDLMQQGSRLLSTTQTATDALRRDLQALVASATHTSADLSEIVAAARHGEGTVGRLLMDPMLADSVSRIASDARQSARVLKDAAARMDDTIADLQGRDLPGRAQAVLENTRQATGQLNRALGAFTSSSAENDSAAGNLRDILSSARTTMDNLAAASEALRHNFFLRGFFNRRGYFTLERMTPAEYRSSPFLIGHSHERIWLSEDELFAARHGAPEQLSEQAQARIDDAMTALLPYLPNSPIIIEGYATQGSPSERFVRAQDRATAVRAYIRKHFRLQPGTIGAMPMSDPLPPEIGKSTWDGVAIVLIR